IATVTDAWLARGSLAGIGIELPTIARMSKDRQGTLDVRIRDDAQPTRRKRRLRVALDWPLQVPPAAEEVDLTLPAEASWTQLSWTCSPSQRGKYRIDSAFVQGSSPLGLWASRRKLRVQTEIRVYPNLLTERKQLASLFLNRSLLGVHTRRQVGRGR